MLKKQEGLPQLTLEDFQGFINSLVHLKPSSKARAIATVKSALSFGLKVGYLVVNVGAVVKLPKLEDKLIVTTPATHPRNAHRYAQLRRTRRAAGSHCRPTIH